MSKFSVIKDKLPIIACVFVVAVWGETFVSSKILLEDGLMPADIFFYRFLIAYVLMSLLSHDMMWSKNWKDELMMFIAGVSGGSVYFLAENLALRYSTAGNVAILVGTTPFVTAVLLSIFYKDERMNRHQLFGSMVAFAGLVLVVLNGQLVLHLNPIGDLLALTASVLWGVYSLAMKNVTCNYDPKFVTRKIFGYGLVTILPWFAFVEPLNMSVDILTRPAVWGNIASLGIVASLLCFLLWNWLLPHVGVVKATNVIYTQCIFTLVISHFVLDERITVMALCGTVILIFGMLIVSNKRIRR